MKKTLIAFLGATFYFFSPLLVSAHGANMPPYFKVNGKYSNYYAVQSTSLDTLVIPQDATPDPSYLINQPIDFEIDVTQLPFPPSILSRVKYDWDFGDGTPHMHGLKNTHAYTKIGSYIIHIEASEGAGEFETVMMNIVPDKNYQLPKAVIKINGEEKSAFGSDPNQATPEGLRYTMAIRPGDALSFDASGSQDASSKITDYLWDFGDGQSTTASTTLHTYDQKFHLVFPLLRVKDANGFFADAFTTVSVDEKNSPLPTPSLSSAGQKQSRSNMQAWLIIGGVVAVVCIGFFIFSLLSNKE